jgi:hypothetical protein
MSFSQSRDDLLTSQAKRQMMLFRPAGSASDHLKPKQPAMSLIPFANVEK